ncbi:hypothetical protein HDU80_006637 [Chytriomyces hyalinus]|nr:hypothetical protein HDU80_006637 [Chytriomyces hyalinus]
MQGPTPKATTSEVTTSEVRRGSADASVSKPKETTSDLDGTTPLDQDQVPDHQAEVREDFLLSSVAVADRRPPVFDPVENPPRREPAPTYAPTQNDPLSELVTGVESLQVQDTDALEVRFEVVLTRDLDPNIKVVDRRFSNRARHRLTGILAPYSVVVTRNGFSLAYTNIHYPEAYIERVLINEAEY